MEGASLVLRLASTCIPFELGLRTLHDAWSTTPDVPSWRTRFSASRPYILVYVQCRQYRANRKKPRYVLGSRRSSILEHAILCILRRTESSFSFEPVRCCDSSPFRCRAVLKVSPMAQAGAPREWTRRLCHHTNATVRGEPECMARVTPWLIAGEQVVPPVETVFSASRVRLVSVHAVLDKINVISDSNSVNI